MCQRWDVMGWLFISSLKWQTKWTHCCVWKKQVYSVFIKKKIFENNQKQCCYFKQKSFGGIFGFCFGFFFTIAWLIWHLNSDGNILYYYVIFFDCSFPYLLVLFRPFFLISTNSMTQIFLVHFIRAVTEGDAPPAPPSLEHWSVTSFLIC